jgi:hypothetical protein
MDQRSVKNVASVKRAGARGCQYTIDDRNTHYVLDMVIRWDNMCRWFWDPHDVEGWRINRQTNHSMRATVPSTDEISPDAPLRLAVAAALAFPDGSMTTSATGHLQVLLPPRRLQRDIRKRATADRATGKVMSARRGE